MKTIKRRPASGALRQPHTRIASPAMAAKTSNGIRRFGPPLPTILSIKILPAMIRKRRIAVTPRGAPGRFTVCRILNTWIKAPANNRARTTSVQRCRRNHQKMKTAGSRRIQKGPLTPPMAKRRMSDTRPRQLSGGTRKGKECLQQGKVPHGIGEYDMDLGRVRNGDVDDSHQHADRQRSPGGAAAREQCGHGKSLDHGAGDVHNQGRPLHGKKQRDTREQPGQRLHIASLREGQRPQPVQVIGLLIPDPTVFGEELRVKQGAGKTSEDGQESRDENRHLPSEANTFPRGCSFKKAHGTYR